MIKMLTHLDNNSVMTIQMDKDEYCTVMALIGVALKMNLLFQDDAAILRRVFNSFAATIDYPIIN